MEKARRNKRKKQSVIKELAFALKNGSYATKLSFFFMGCGQIARGQLGKGLLYLFVQLLFSLFLIFFGGRYILHLFSGDLGSKLSGEIWNESLQIFEKVKGDNSFLILLYGVVSILLVGVFISPYPNPPFSFEGKGGIILRLSPRLPLSFRRIPSKFCRHILPPRYRG